MLSWSTVTCRLVRPDLVQGRIGLLRTLESPVVSGRCTVEDCETIYVEVTRIAEVAAAATAGHDGGSREREMQRGGHVFMKPTGAYFNSTTISWGRAYTTCSEDSTLTECVSMYSDWNNTLPAHALRISQLGLRHQWHRNSVPVFIMPIWRS